MEVLHSGYLVPFYHLPPILWEPLKNPFLQLTVWEHSGISRRSGQNAGERREPRRSKILGHVTAADFFFRRPTFLQKASGGWRPVINFSSLNDYVTLTKFKIETVFLVLEAIRKET